MKNTQGVPGGRGQTAPESPPRRLPHDSLWALLMMSLRGSLHADTGVWTSVVIEGDEAGYALQCVMVRLEAFLTIDHLRLEDAVHTLCNGIVGGLVILRHTDIDAVPFQFGRIVVTAVLYASVRVMDESFQLICRSLRDGHVEGLERMFRLERPGQAPAYNLVRVGVRHQMQIAAAVHEVDVRDVAHPQLIGACGYETTDEILVLVVAVVRIRRMARLRALLHQLEVAQ